MSLRQDTAQAWFCPEDRGTVPSLPVSQRALCNLHPGDGLETCGGGWRGCSLSFHTQSSDKAWRWGERQSCPVNRRAEGTEGPSAGECAASGLGRAGEPPSRRLAALMWAAALVAVPWDLGTRNRIRERTRGRRPRFPEGTMAILPLKAEVWGRGKASRAGGAGADAARPAEPGVCAGHSIRPGLRDARTQASSRRWLYPRVTLRGAPDVAPTPALWPPTTPGRGPRSCTGRRSHTLCLAGL